MQTQEAQRKVAIIVSKGGLDEVYPALILGNAARMSGIEAVLFFTFYGLDAVTDKKVDHLHVNLVGNPASPIPTMIGGLPGMENLAASMMKKQMEDLDLPGVREMMEMLTDAGAELYGCQLAMDMMKIDQKDLIPQVADVITAGDFYEMADGAQIIFT
ncbi:MAG: DsrE/DsrF/DrsH-like family protein [Deltaproteobacteria bacterium]|nr:DsrE/DsrF/DrsH-like family protein [Deltaproteobacteria bacterium]